MSPESFTWWLHGWSEINGGAAPTAAQWQIINDHLNLVFNKVTPNRPQGAPHSAPMVPFTGHPPITGMIPVSGYPGLVYMPSPSPLLVC